MDDLFYLLSKSLWVILQPSNFLIFLLLIGLILTRTAWRRLGRRLFALALSALIIVSLFPVGQLLLAPLENRFDATTNTEPDGILILGGALEGGQSEARGSYHFSTAVDRPLALHELTSYYPEAEVIVTGIGDAAALEALQTAWGLAGVDMKFENEARTTAEHPSYAARLAIADPQSRWLLVTSAYHMPRAMGVFRAAGWSVYPYPVDYQTPPEISWRWPRASLNLTELDLAAKEWLGLLAYWLTGRSSSFFPGPMPAG